MVDVRRSMFLHLPLQMTAPSTLILGILNIESSYLDNLERPAGAVPDTVQFWFAPDSQWRTKTYAIDHDIHIHQVATVEGEEPLDTGIACESTSYFYNPDGGAYRTQSDPEG